MTRVETQHWMMVEVLEQHDPVRIANRPRGRSVFKQVDARDEGICQYVLPDGSSCGSKLWVHQHHIQPRSEGGPDTLENLITLCAAHHRMVHSGH